MDDVVFDIWTEYRPPVGLQKRGAVEYAFVSRCRKWSARKGPKGTMILTDRTTGENHAITGRMPEVEAFIRANANANGGHRP